MTFVLHRSIWPGERRPPRTSWGGSSLSWQALTARGSGGTFSARGL